MRQWILTASALALACGTAQAQAQTALDTDDDTTVLDTIVVTTPLRRESSLERSTSSVIVIDREEIDRAAALDLPSLLRSYAGITVTSNGGMGASSGIGI